jgi:hypothetical protein
VRLAQLRARSALSTQAAYRLITTALMQRRSLDALLQTTTFANRQSPTRTARYGIAMIIPDSNGSEPDVHLRRLTP